MDACLEGLVGCVRGPVKSSFKVRGRVGQWESFPAKDHEERYPPVPGVGLLPWI